MKYTIRLRIHRELERHNRKSRQDMLMITCIADARELDPPSHFIHDAVEAILCSRFYEASTTCKRTVDMLLQWFDKQEIKRICTVHLETEGC